MSDFCGLIFVQHHIDALSEKTKGAEANAMEYVIEVFKRREICRHLSNGADRLEHAAGFRTTSWCRSPDKRPVISVRALSDGLPERHSD